MTQLSESLRTQQEYLTDLRREFHEHPEIGLQEFWTADRIEKELDQFGVAHVRVGSTGVLGTIEGSGHGGGSIALRADIDGLPVQEINSVSYRSQNDGVMHACGHDSHIVSLLGAAKALSEARSAFGGTVKLIFQPDEEHGYGALDFVDAGVLEGVERTFGLHAASDLPSGTLGICEGLNFAAVDLFTINVHGAGAHVSRPHLGGDALYIASSIVVAIQALVARTTDPVEPVVIGVGSFHAGTTYNALAETAMLEGTTRTVDEATRLALRAKIDQLVTSTAATFGASAEVSWRHVTPAVVNPRDVSEEVALAAAEIGSDVVIVKERPYSLGGDNFAEFQARVPGVYAFVGTGNPEVPNSQNSHHNGNFDIDEAALPLGASLYAEYAYWWLTKGTARD
ncbi:M20 metallopeptidase family protein [Ancrocorticia populi]|uniref:M20 metallopeptidase family protein n=1 Tax=Ancrocorticia populi TaxID=2175228 RepID=UPI003F908AAA